MRAQLATVRPNKQGKHVLVVFACLFCFWCSWAGCSLSSTSTCRCRRAPGCRCRCICTTTATVQANEAAAMPRIHPSEQASFRIGPRHIYAGKACLHYSTIASKLCMYARTYVPIYNISDPFIKSTTIDRHVSICRWVHIDTIQGI